MSIAIFKIAIFLLKDNREYSLPLYIFTTLILSETNLIRSKVGHLDTDRFGQNAWEDAIFSITTEI